MRRLEEERSSRNRERSRSLGRRVTVLDDSCGFGKERNRTRRSTRRRVVSDRIGRVQCVRRPGDD